MHFKVLIFLVLTLYQVKGSTHWVVTEDGRIQQQLESPFAMKQPDNLVSFMRQERDHSALKDAKKKLIEEQVEIENNEDKDVQLESRHYRQDPDCRKAGQRLPDFDLFITSVLPLSQKDIQVSDHIDLVKVVAYAIVEPNCTKYYDLPYSIHAYDHLEGVQNRHLFASYPVAGLKTTLEFLEEPGDAATAITKALEKNTTSWVLYNLAAFYWRMKGDLSGAVECIRRALHFSPEDCKDVALVNLAHILHRSRYTLNGTVVMHHALRLSSQFNINYFALGNMYAILGEFNQSIYYYEQTLKFQSDFTTARKQLAAVKCQLKLQEKLEDQHTSLQRTLEELQKYKVKHESYLDQQAHFSKHHLSPQTLAEQHAYLEQQRMKEGSFGHKCQFQANKSGPVLMCSLPSSHVPSFEDEKKEYYRDDRKPIPLTPNAKKVREELSPRSQTNKRPKKSKRNITASQTQDEKKESDRTESKETEYNPMYDWTDPSWPPLKSCEEYVQSLAVWDEFPSAYVDPETRGFKVRELLTSYIGISDGMHELPWNKPNCVNLESVETTPYDHIIALPSAVSPFKQDNFLSNFLLMHVNGGRVWPDDLGQRILSALQKALQQKDEDHIWVLYNLAGLFWRVNGDNVNAIECLRRSVDRVPVRHTDIPLVSLANIMYRLGKFNDAVHLLIYALRVNDSEPATYLSMGNALQAQGNISGAVEFYRYAMVLHPQFQEAFHSLFIVKCRNLTESGNPKTSEEILAEWRAKHSEPEKTPDKSKENEKETPKQTEDEEATMSNVENTADDVVTKLVTEKMDVVVVDQLLQQSDNVINELKNASSGNLDEKMSTARELMAKLAEMRNSLGHLLDEASTTLDESRYEVSCDIAISKVDFGFASNSSYLSSIDLEVDLTATSDSLEPECDINDDWSEIVLNHVIEVESFLDGPEETGHSKTLHKILKTTNVGKTLRSAFISDSISWKLPLVTSFFWRITGSAKKAVKCLLYSLHLVPSDERNLILYAIADYLALLSRNKEAVEVAMLTETDKSSVEIQYLIGNVFASEGRHSEAVKHYQLASNLDQHFGDIRLRHKASTCRSSL